MTQNKLFIVAPPAPPKPEPVIYLRRLTYPQGFRPERPDYYMRTRPNLPWRRLNTQGRDLWQALGLPDEDGEYELEVSVAVPAKQRELL